MKWVMVLTLLIISSDVYSQVRGTTWGDSWEQVEETIKEDAVYENTLIALAGADVVNYSIRLKNYNRIQLTAGDTTGVGYFFLDDKLASIQVNYKDPKISISEFRDIADLLSRKYGDPKEDRIDDEPSEAIENWNKVLDEALQKGEMLIERIWEDDETYARLEMGYDEDGPILMLIYFSQLYYDKFVEEIDRAILNDF